MLGYNVLWLLAVGRVNDLMLLLAGLIRFDGKLNGLLRCRGRGRSIFGLLFHVNRTNGHYVVDGTDARIISR